MITTSAITSLPTHDKTIAAKRHKTINLLKHKQLLTRQSIPSCAQQQSKDKDYKLRYCKSRTSTELDISLRPAQHRTTERATSFSIHDSQPVREESRVLQRKIFLPKIRT